MQVDRHSSEDASWRHSSSRENVTNSIWDNDPTPSVEADVHLLEPGSHQLRSDRSMNKAVTAETSRVKSEQPPRELSPDKALTTDNTWSPLGLQSGFLIFLSATALSAAAVCIALLIYSTSNFGLGTDDGRPSLSFAWRFLPTLVSVLYVIGTSIVFNDVNRTEAFSRLSRPTLSNPRWTLLRTPGAWWKTLGEAFNRTKNGQRTNWVLLFATTVYIIGFLAVSPLSSSLLDSLAITVSSTNFFTQSDVLHNSGLPFNINQDAILRTVAHQLQNLTTSAWINDEYFILPFRPTGASSDRVGPTIADSSGEWKTSAIVFKTDMECRTMHVARVSSGIRAPNSTLSYNTILFSDDKGCNLTFGNAGIITPQGIGSWFIAPDYVEAWPGDPPVSSGVHPIITDACRGREIILAISAWPLSHNVNSTALPLNDSLAACYVCDTTFYVANSSVTVSTDNQGISTVLVDEDDFVRKRAVMQPGLLNTTHFQQSMVSTNWTSILDRTGVYAITPYTGGPLRLLSGMYNFNMTSMILDTNLTSKANRFKQRFLGETILAALPEISGMNRTSIVAEVNVEQQRIVVSAGVAIALIILLFLSAMQILFILFAARLSQRPLHVNQDPSSLTGLATLLLHENSTRKLFRGAEQVTSSDLVNMLKGTQHQLTEDGLHSIGQLQRIPVNSKKDDWRPVATKRRNGFGLLIYLALLIGGVAAFWAVYVRSGLYGSAFSLEGRVTIRNSTFVLAPYSMIPTLLAVLLGLWWSDIVQTFRRVQPYVEMASRPTKMSSGPQLTYASSYVMFGAFKAARKRHWMLALLFLGAVFTEVFTVSMSAIWRRKPISIDEEVVLTPQFDFRTSPQMFHFQAPETGSVNSIPAETLASLYSSLNTNWMYSALLHLVFNASEPAWSKDSWSFTPLDLSIINNSSAVIQNSDSEQLADRRSLSEESAINVTLRTSALRARLECSPYGASNLSSWLKQWDLTSSTQWDLSANPTDLQTGYQLGSISNVSLGLNNQTTPTWSNVMQLMFGNSSVGIPILNYETPLQCCPNTSAGTIEPMGVGFWTYPAFFYDHYADTFNSSFQQRSSVRGDNITTKLIYGHPQQQLYQSNAAFNDISDWDNEGNLIWREVPEITALNCQPFIEFADADVKVDRFSGAVQDFTILSEPQAIEHDAWNASYTIANYTDNFYRGKHANYVTSYGNLFQDALILASDLADIGGFGPGGHRITEPLEDRTFNYRTPGLNMDFMTYAMYNMVGQNLTALLDPTTQARLANQVYGTFFQHFVSSNVTKDGSWTYVPVGTNKFDPDLRPYNHSAYPKYDKVTATVSRRIQGMEMSPVATSLCLGVLSFLAITTIIVYLIDFRHFDRLRHDVETMADVIRLVADSPKFLAWVAEESRVRHTRNQQPTAQGKSGDGRSWRRFWRSNPYQALAQEREKRREPRVRLGTFVGTDGERKWIVEMDD